MAIIREDKIFSVLSGCFKARRVEVYAWYWLSRLDLQLNKSNVIVDNIINVLRNNPEYVARINVEIAANLIDGKYFNWINDDVRMLKFLEEKIKLVSMIELPSNIIGKNRFISLIDICSLGRNEKIQLIEQVKKDWAVKLSGDGVYDWFDSGDVKDRLNYAWKWLGRNEGEKIYGKLQFKSKGELIVFFESIFLNEFEIKFKVEKIKKLWSSQESKKKQLEKKQFNTYIRIDTIERLQYLAAKNKISMAEVVEVLVNSEFEVGVYMDGVEKKRI